MNNFILKAIQESRKVWYSAARPLDTYDQGLHFATKAKAVSFMDHHEMWDEYSLVHCRVSTMTRRMNAHNARVMSYHASRLKVKEEIDALIRKIEETEEFI